MEHGLALPSGAACDEEAAPLKRAVALFAALAVTASTPTLTLAAPRTKAAKAAFTRGVAAYQRDDWEKAAAALEQSFALEEDVETLYAWAQAVRQLEDCEKASELYRKLLKFELPDENKEVIREKLEECREILHPSFQDPDADPDLGTGRRPGEEVAEETPAPRLTPRRTAWYTDVLGDTLLGAGSLAVLVGGGFLLSGYRADTATSATYDEFVENNDRAESHGMIGSGALTLGVVLVGAAVIRYATRSGLAPAKARREGGASASLAPWWSPGAGGLTAMGRF